MPLDCLMYEMLYDKKHFRYSTEYVNILILSPCTVFVKSRNFILSLENDVMAKCCVNLFSLIFILKCLSKSNLIQMSKELVVKISFVYTFCL